MKNNAVNATTSTRSSASRTSNASPNAFVATLGDTSVSDDFTYMASTAEDVAQCYALSLNPSTARKSLCTKCNRKHYVGRDGQCWTGILCTICNLYDHPADSCFKRCKSDSCHSKTIPHHKEQCPSSTEPSADILKRNYEALVAACKEKGIPVPEPPPLSA